MKNRKGFIKIAPEFLHGLPNVEIIKTMYSEFFPYKIVYNGDDELAVIYGYCSSFDELKKGERVPEYEIWVEETGESTYIVGDINRV